MSVFKKRKLLKKYTKDYNTTTTMGHHGDCIWCNKSILENSFMVFRRDIDSRLWSVHRSFHSMCANHMQWHLKGISTKCILLLVWAFPEIPSVLWRHIFTDYLV